MDEACRHKAPQSEEGGLSVGLQPVHVLRGLLRQRALSSVELLEMCIARYETYNPAINAVVVERIDAARQTARDADRALLSGADVGPFHGIPVTVKECIDWAGTASTWGDRSFVDNIVDRNAAVVDRLLGAGAIIWGKTNVPKHLMDWQTFNDVYGVTSNPFDLERTPGGSSGGSSAALAAGFSALEVGSDIGGSIRFPAHYAGVFGHKPSFGAVSQAGHDFPSPQRADVDINVVGPLARSAVDLADAMAVLSHWKFATEPPSALTDIRAGVLLQNPCGGAQDTTMTTVLDEAVQALATAGLEIVDPPTTIDFVRAQEVFRLLNSAGNSTEPPTDEQREHARRFDGGSRDFEAMSGKSASLGHREWLQLCEEREHLREAWRQYFTRSAFGVDRGNRQGADILLCPVSATAAPPHQHGLPFEEQTILVNGQKTSVTDQWFWAGIASGPYLPSTVAPVGQTADGLPVGIQIIADFGNDPTSIRAAQLIEQHLGGFVPPRLG